MTMYKYGVLGALVVLLLLLRGLFWSQPAHEPKRQAQAQTPPSASVQATTRTVARRSSPARPASTPPARDDHDQAHYQYQHQDDPHVVFGNTARSAGERFSALAILAQGGNANAKYFTLQIARHCATINKIPDDQPPTGQSAATPYQIQLRAQMKAACVQVTTDPAYAEYAKLLESHAIEAYAEKMHQTIELFFADNGPDAALHAAVSAINQRPDDATVGMVGDALADLDIASDYLQQKFPGLAPADPDKRKELLRFALNLLACRDGYPCGPNSFVVQTTCTDLAACLPGADLLGVYESQILSAQEMAYVRALLVYLQQFPPNVAWQ